MHLRPVATLGAIAALAVIALTGCSPAEPSISPSDLAIALNEPTGTTSPLTIPEVTAAFTAAGLTVSNPRDNTDTGRCAAGVYDCTIYFTTDEAAIILFPSTAKAAEVKERLADTALEDGFVFSSGPAALNFGGRTTSVTDQAKYSAALESIAAGK